MLFGVHPTADVLLAAIGLTRDDVGRFRDCYWNGEHIAVYTRNGGGNRECWHADDPRRGSAACHGEPWEEEVDEIVYLLAAEGLARGYTQAWTIIGRETQPFRTGRRVTTTSHTCGGPNSATCGCPGCVIEHRLPKHAAYVRDEDDDFDATYATIYFTPPAWLIDALRAFAVSAADATPAQRWTALFERLTSAPADDPQVQRVIEAMRPAMDAILGAVNDDERKDG